MFSSEQAGKCHLADINCKVNWQYMAQMYVS